MWIQTLSPALREQEAWPAPSSASSLVGATVRLPGASGTTIVWDNVRDA